jgi:flagellar basal body rod protein FlgG
MKTKYMLSLLPIMLFLTGCQKNLHVATPAPDSPVQNSSQRLMVQSLKEELKEQQQLQIEIAELVKEIRDSKNAQRDVLVATSKTIDNAMDITLHNIANCKTTGFKRQGVHIQDGKIIDDYLVLTQGDFIRTSNSLDIVIQGQGFFRIRQSSGEIAYTRNGNFQLNRDGDIVSSEGNLLYPQINIPRDQTGITLGSDGTVSVAISAKSQSQQVGRVELAWFQNPSGLKALGPNFFVETPASGKPVVTAPGENGAGTILTGYLEDSNVNILEELIQLRTLRSWKNGVDQALLTIDEGQK